jgi:hypothetical protein
MSTLVFLDTEFTDLSSSGSLISAGFITEKGEEYYAELSNFNERECNDFVKAQVLPLLSGPGISMEAFVRRLTLWLANMDGEVVLVADSEWDRKMLEKAFSSVGLPLPPGWLFRKVPDHFPSGQQRQIFNDEMAAYFLRHPKETPHHALSDARAVRNGYLRAQAVG